MYLIRRYELWQVVLFNAVIILAGAGLYYVIANRAPLFGTPTSSVTQEINSSSENDRLYSVATISHGHGLAVDVADPAKVYIATHEGLLTLTNEKGLYRIGDTQDDLMGFSPHPTDSNIFFSSGHPHTGGGNLGFQRSDDGGLTWQKVSPGSNGPVDFHAMAVSPVNPNLIYGWYYNALQRSRDGGQTWAVVPSNLAQVISLVADVTNEKTLYATTPHGIQNSLDEGLTWNPLTTEPLGAVSALAINPKEPQRMLSFSERRGLSKSIDGGKTWHTINASFSNSPVMFIAYSKTNVQKVYALTHGNELYGSGDAGVTWSKIK